VLLSLKRCIIINSRAIYIERSAGGASKVLPSPGDDETLPRLVQLRDLEG